MIPSCWAGLPVTDKTVKGPGSERSVAEHGEADLAVLAAARAVAHGRGAGVRLPGLTVEDASEMSQGGTFWQPSLA